MTSLSQTETFYFYMKKVKIYTKTKQSSNYPNNTSVNSYALFKTKTLSASQKISIGRDIAAKIRLQLQNLAINLVTIKATNRRKITITIY